MVDGGRRECVLHGNFKVKKLKGHHDKVTELFISKGVVSGQVIAASTYSMVLIFFEWSQVRVYRAYSQSRKSIESIAVLPGKGVGTGGQSDMAPRFHTRGATSDCGPQKWRWKSDMGHLQLYL